MNPSLTPLETLLLWKMLFLGYEPAQSKTKPELKPPARNRLVEAGLIEIEKRGRSKHIVLTDKAWLWASENLDAEISTRSYEAGPVLHDVLSRLKVFFQKNNVPLAEFLQTDSATVPVPEPPSLEERIREAYQQVSDGRWNTLVRLAELRKALPGVPREQLDDELRRLKIENSILLLLMEDPQDISPEDEAAALHASNRINHLILIER